MHAAVADESSGAGQARPTIGSQQQQARLSIPVHVR
jgi:hypothetical protein